MLGSVTSPTKMPSEPSQVTRPNPYVGLRDVLNKASGAHVLFLEAWRQRPRQRPKLKRDTEPSTTQ